MNDLLKYAQRRYAEVRNVREKENQYDPYFTVVKSSKGNFYDSVPLTGGINPICCERSAITQMITYEGDTAKASELVLVGAIGKGGILSPCGLCRQVLYDNNPEMKVIVASGLFRKKENCDFIFDNPKTYQISELLPFAWKVGNWD